VFARSDLIRALLSKALPDPEAGGAIDPVFHSFLNTFVETIDLPCRITPLLVEAFDGASLGPARSAQLQMRDLVLALVRDRVLEATPPLPLADLVRALTAGDFSGAAECLADRTNENDAAWALKEVLSRCAQAEQHGSFYASEGDYSIASGVIAGITSLSPSDADARYAAMMTMRPVLAGLTASLFSEPAAHLGFAVATIAESGGEEGEGFARRVLTMLRPLARFGSGDDRSTNMASSVQSRFMGMLFDAAPDVEAFDPIFSTFVLELVERVDIDARMLPLLEEAVRDFVVGAPRPATEQLLGALNAARSLLTEAGLLGDARVPQLLLARQYGEAARLLGVHTAWSDKDDGDVLSAERWSAETWGMHAVRRFGTALAQAGRLTENPSGEEERSALYFVSPTRELARAVACVVRGSGVEAPRKLLDATKVIIGTLARAEGPSGS
jgi:hypothetical protein